MATFPMFQCQDGVQDFKRGSYRGGLWHDSRTKKITNHGSRILKFHFPESRKKVLFYPVLTLQIVFEEIKID